MTSVAPVGFRRGLGVVAVVVVVGVWLYRREDHSLGVSLPVTTPISDIILILDRCTVYSTRIAC